MARRSFHIRRQAGNPHFPPNIRLLTTIIPIMAFLFLLSYLLRLLPLLLCLFEIIRRKPVRQEMCLHLRANPPSFAHGLYDLANSSTAARAMYRRAPEPQS